MAFHKLAVSLMLLASYHAIAKEKSYPSLNSTQIGVQHIEYQETLSSFADVGDLSTKSSVTNVILFASSYTHINENWGFLLNTKSDVTKEYTKDFWDIDGYGEVQSNTTKFGLSDLVAQGVYHLEDGLIVKMGGQLKSLIVVRSNFEGIGNYQELNADIRSSDKYFLDPSPPQIYKNALAVEEDLTYFNATLGVHYNSAFIQNRKRLSWNIGADLAIPVYSTAKNSALEQERGIETIDATFNGFEARLSAGLNYEIKKGIALTLNADYLVAQYQEMSTDFTVASSQGDIKRTAAIPDIEMSTAQLTFGILWIN